MKQEWTARQWICLALSTLAYLVVALFVLRNVVPDPLHLLPHNGSIDKASRRMGHLDQSMVIAVVTRNAQALATDPANILGDGQCFPFPNSFTLGEHMLGEGLLMVLPWLATGDPILAYNLLLLLTLWIPGITMYLLVHHFTRHPGAAFGAGLFFVLVTARINDGGHPFLHADFWLPLSLLFLHKLFTEEARWRNAAGVGFFLALEALESIYILLGCSVITAVYGLFLLWSYRDRWKAVALPLAASAAFSVGVAAVVLWPYFDTRETWSVLSGRTTLFLPLTAYQPGSIYFLGFLASGLIVVALVDRLRRRRDAAGMDPRWAFFVAGVLVLWASVDRIPIGSTGMAIPGLFYLLSGVVPGLDAIRALFTVGHTISIPASLLAGYGILVLVERLRRSTLILAMSLLSLAIVAERFVGPVAEWNFGIRLELGAWEARPDEEDIAIVRGMEPGPVFDVPMPKPRSGLQTRGVSRRLLLQSWNPQPSSSCYNSFDTPLADQLYQLARELPERSAAEALAAIGFRTVASHTRGWWPPHLARWKARFAREPAIEEVLVPGPESAGLATYRLRPRTAVVTDPDRLQARFSDPEVRLEVGDRTAGPTSIPFLFHNPGPFTFRHPGEIAPRDALLRWRTGGEDIGAPQRVRVLWPLALGPGGTLEVEVLSRSIPASGSYQALLVDPENPDRILASRAVKISAAAPGLAQK